MTTGVTSRPTRTGRQQFTGFFLGSLAGIAADLSAFALLGYLGVGPFLANVVSSAVAICITYRIVTRIAFHMSESPRSFIVFVSWYAISISAFSLLIDTAVAVSGGLALLWKVISLPLSFVVNFFFTRVLFARVRDAELRRGPVGDGTGWLQGRRTLSVLVIATIAALVAAGSLLTLRGSLTSDSLFLDDLTRDIFALGGRWSDWRLTPAAAYVPDMLLYFVGSVFLPTAEARIAFVSVAQWALLGAAIAWLSKVLVPRQKTAGLLLVLLGYGAFTLVASRSDIWVFFYSTNNHFAALLLPLLALSASLCYLDDRRRRWLVVIFVCGVAGQVSTSLYLLAYAIPAAAMMAAALLLFRAKRNSSVWRAVIVLLAVTLSAVASASLISRAITFNDPGAGRTAFTFDGLVNSERALLGATRYAFQSGSSLLTLFSLAVVAAISYLIIRAGSRVATVRRTPETGSVLGWTVAHPDSALRIIAGVLGILSLLVSLVGSLLSGGFIDIYGYRYFAFPLLLLTLLAVVYASTAGWSELSTRLLVGAGALTLIISSVVSVQPVGSGLGRNSAALAQRGEESAECLDRLRQQGVELTAGIADYWNARGVVDRDHPSTELVALLNNLAPFYWMSTSGPLLRPETYTAVEYDFAILEPVGSRTQFDFTADTVGRLLPPPNARYSCENGLDVWTWDDARLDGVVRDAASLWSFTAGFSDEAEFSADILPSQTDNDAATGRTGAGDGAGEYIVYGPYVTLPAGRYRVEMDYTAEYPASATETAVASWDTGSFVAGPTTAPLTEGRLPGDRLTASDEFELTEPLDGWEVRVEYEGEGEVEVKSFRLERTGG